MEDKQVEQQEQKKPEGPKVSDWVKKFNSAARVMRDEFLCKYQLANDRIRADYEAKGRGTRRMTHEQVNLCKSIGESFVNSVYYKSPTCNLTAREETDHDKVENTEIKVNDWLKDKKVKKVVKRAIWDAYKGGFGAIFTDYEYDDMDDTERPVMVPTEDIDPVTGSTVRGQKQAVDENDQPLFERIVLKNEITIQRLRPDLVRFPKGFDFDQFQESPWIGFEVILPIDEIKSNENWDEKAREKIEGQRFDSLSSDGKYKAKKEEDGTDLYGKISYCFVKPDVPAIQPFKLYVFSEGCDTFLQVIDFKKGHIGYPIKFIYFNPLDDDSSYPNGDPWNIESQLSAADEWWKKVVSHVKRANPKKIYNSGVIDPQEVQKLKANNDNELVGIKNKANQDLRALVMNLESAGYPKDLDKMYEVARQLMSEISPKTNLSRGSGDQSNTATEAKIMQVGETIDIDARIDDVADLIKDIVLDVAGMLENSLVAPVTITKEQVGEGGEAYPVPVEVGADGFTSKINADVDIESMQSQNKDVIRRQLIDALGLFEKLKPFTDMLGIMPDPKFWIEKLMDTMTIKNVDKGFVPIPAGALMAQAQASQGGKQPSKSEGAMPQEAIEAGLAQRAA